MSNTINKNQEIDYQPILTRRYTSTTLDILFVFLIYYIVGISFHVFEEYETRLKILFFFSFVWVYETILTSFACTLGQYIVGIRVRNNNDITKKLNIIKLLFRSIFKYPLFIISFFSIGFNPKKRAAHDLIVGSISLSAEMVDAKGPHLVIRKVLKNKWFRFTLAIIIFILWVIWIGNYWLFLGLPFFYDVYISKKVNWAFWKKRAIPGVKRKKGKVAEWVDAIVFAVVAATLIRMFFIEAFTIPTSSMEKTLLVGDYLFVSKVSYGPKTPNTPLAIPFTHNNFMGKYEPYLDIVNWEYRRLAGIGEIKRYDAMVFNFPTGDTVVVGRSNQGYYDIIMVKAYELNEIDKMRGDSSKTWNYYLDAARKNIWANYDIIVRPLDKKDNYIKRCVALPGDKLEIKAGDLFINDEKHPKFHGLQYNYLVFTNGSRINPKTIDKLGISLEDENKNKDFMYDINAINMIQEDSTLDKFNINNVYVYPLTDENADKLSKLPNVLRTEKLIKPKNARNFRIFPYSDVYKWNEDWFGPIVIPKKGETVKINTLNLPLYERIIDYYESNDLVVKDNEIFINGAKTDEYTFKMDYYWLMGDNRHGSADSRFWGFVPEDHVVGKAVFIWLSLDKDKGWFNGKIRWNRMFRLVSNLE
ncbi:MAG: signal peptidase I [Bacteroidota bacterium]